MIVVCPSVKNVQMATAVMLQALAHVRLVNNIVDATCEGDPYLVSEVIRGWDEAELASPVLEDSFLDEFRKSELFLIFDFRLDGSIGSITTMSRQTLYGGGASAAS